MFFDICDGHGQFSCTCCSAWQLLLRVRPASSDRHPAPDVLLSCAPHQVSRCTISLLDLDSINFALHSSLLFFLQLSAALALHAKTAASSPPATRNYPSNSTLTPTRGACSPWAEGGVVRREGDEHGPVAFLVQMTFVCCEFVP